MVDPKVERLIQQILSKRGDLTREKIMELIEQKKAEIGSGYLTDMGALYLVASDLNIALEPQEEYLLNQIREGMRNVDVIAYFLFQTDERGYLDRKGIKRKYRTIYLYYEDIVRAVLWDEASDLPIRLALKPSEKLRLRKCSVRKGRDGRPELHLNNQSEIIIEPDHAGEGREKLESITEDVSNINLDKKLHVVKGEVVHPIRTLAYTNRNGKRSSAITFHMKSIQNENTTRIVIWDPSQAVIEGIKEGQILRIIGLTLRRGQYTELELHGDRNTQIEILGVAKRANVKEFLVFSSGVVRDGKVSLLILDKENENIYLLRLSESQAKKLRGPGTKIKIPRNKFTIKGNSLFLDNDLEVLNEIEEEPLNKFKVKISNLKEKMGPVIIEVTTLSKPRVQELKTRNGKIIKRSSLLVGDDTGETRVYAWRENVELLEGIMPGERVLFFGILPKKDPYEDEVILEVKDFTQIERKRIH